MSLVSFNLFVGGGIGTFANGRVLTVWALGVVFVFAATIWRENRGRSEVTQSGAGF